MDGKYAEDGTPPYESWKDALDAEDALEGMPPGIEWNVEWIKEKRNIRSHKWNWVGICRIWKRSNNLY